MGLYLCIFAAKDHDDELDGVEVGSYADFDTFRSTVAARLEGGAWAARFPVLMSHSDSDGEWAPRAAQELEAELATIQAELTQLPAIAFAPGSWQQAVARTLGLKPSTLDDCFIDIDGESLLKRLRGLARLAVTRDQPISFQ